VSEIEARDRAAVERVAATLVDADNARDLHRVLSCYADDAALFPPNEPPVRGKAGIRPRYELLFYTFQPEIVSTVEEIRVAGEWTYVIGHNGGRLLPSAGGSARALDDEFVMLLARQQGKWLISRLIWHSARPRPAPP